MAQTINRMSACFISLSSRVRQTVWGSAELLSMACLRASSSEKSASIKGRTAKPTIHVDVFVFRDYFKPSFFPAASREIDSRMRVTRVSARLAV